jgi:carotenoid cleavage dioxygenase-like enzyme
VVLFGTDVMSSSQLHGCTGVSAERLQRRDKPVANTSLAEWDGKLWALWEAHRPYVLDPDTLETHGEETLGAWGLEARAHEPLSAHVCQGHSAPSSALSPDLLVNSSTSVLQAGR